MQLHLGQLFLIVKRLLVPSRYRLRIQRLNLALPVEQGACRLLNESVAVNEAQTLHSGHTLF